MMKHQRTILDTSNGTLSSFRSALFSYSMKYQYKCPVQLIGRSVCTRPQTRYPAELPRSWREERDEEKRGMERGMERREGWREDCFSFKAFQYLLENSQVKYLNTYIYKNYLQKHTVKPKNIHTRL